MENLGKNNLVMYLPEEDGEYGIRISIQEKTLLIQYKKAINGCIKFINDANILLNTFNNDKFELSAFLIYLVDKTIKLKNKIFVSKE